MSPLNVRDYKTFVIFYNYDEYKFENKSLLNLIQSFCRN